ncbi:MAG: M20 family metallopeptidase [Thermomicrobiales bacterium]|nr:M20 family metallopeptidase [Thermomicrobiales bacterium]
MADRITAAQHMIDDEALVETLAQLVRIRSVYDPAHPDGNERAAADFISALLESWSMHYRRREVAPNRPNLVVDLPGRAPGPTLVFEGHTDVVTAGDRAAWSVDPFGAAIVDGRLYGRGACDMKGGLVAMLFAARALQLSGCDYAGCVRLAIMVDEEGMMSGAKAFVADGELDGVAAAIICEPEGDRLCIAQKGALRARVTLHGRMAHGCMPEQGINPVAALGEVVVECRHLEQEVRAASVPHALLGHFSLTPTVALAGEPAQANVIPSGAELLLDVRTTGEHDHAELRTLIADRLQQAAHRVPGAGMAIEWLDDRPATETSPDAQIVVAVSDAHKAETGEAPPFGGVPGSTDGTIFWAATRVPLVTYGPGATTLPHQADEWVALDEVVRYARTYVGAALRFFDLQESG